MKTYRSLSSKTTQALGESLAKELSHAAHGRSGARGAAIFALQGELGAGKTTFVRGFLKGLGLKRRAQSPTFIIMRRHALAKSRGGFRHVFHVDAYRLKKAGQLQALDFQAILADPRNVILIEWPERVKRALPKNARWIFFEHGKRGNERTIIMKK